MWLRTGFSYPGGKGFTKAAVYAKTIFIPQDNLTDDYNFLPVTSLNRAKFEVM